jgi:hypothetical protein
LPQPLPLTAGRLHFIRRVAPDGTLRFLGERWKVGKRFAHYYVWATVIPSTNGWRFIINTLNARPYGWSKCSRIKSRSQSTLSVPNTSGNHHAPTAHDVVRQAPPTLLSTMS